MDSAGMFLQHRWANARLFGFCESLDAATLDAGVPGTYGTIAATLVHVVAAQSRYLAALRGEPRPSAFAEGMRFPGVAALRDEARRSDDALIEAARTRDGGELLRGDHGGRPFEMKLVIPMAQAINHGTEHRAHVCTILGALGIAAPQIDAWGWADAGGE